MCNPLIFYDENSRKEKHHTTTTTKFDTVFDRSAEVLQTENQIQSNRS